MQQEHTPGGDGGRGLKEGLGGLSEQNCDCFLVILFEIASQGTVLVTTEHSVQPNRPMRVLSRESCVNTLLQPLVLYKRRLGKGGRSWS